MDLLTRQPLGLTRQAAQRNNEALTSSTICVCLGLHVVEKSDNLFISGYGVFHSLQSASMLVHYHVWFSEQYGYTFSSLYLSKLIFRAIKWLAQVLLVSEGWTNKTGPWICYSRERARMAFQNYLETFKLYICPPLVVNPAPLFPLTLFPWDYVASLGCLRVEWGLKTSDSYTLIRIK